jgi:Protein of unknown function (DUF3102)
MTTNGADPALAEHAKKIRGLGKRVVGDVIEIGALLTECKRIAGHGSWLPWLKREFGWTDKTAERFMSVHTLAGKFDNLSNLELPLSGLYLLAAPSTPVKTRDDIIERAQAGERVAIAEVKRTINAAKGRQPPAKRMRNHTRARLYRALKLGDEVMAKIKGTSLDNAREMDELVFLNRGAPKGGHTEIVKRFVADAAAGKEVSAIKYTKSGAAFRRDDIGADSSGKADRLRARVGALQAELRRREIKITGLESELADLKDDARACEVVGGAVKKDEAWQIDELVRAWKQASETARQKFMAFFELQSAAARVTDEGLGNPDFLRRVEQ